MKKYIILLCAAALFLGSCYMLLPPKEDDPNEKKFWAIDFTKAGQRRYFYQAKARRLYEGEKCVIYAETSAGISAEAAENFALEYDEKIYGLMLEYFCDRNFTVGQTTYNDTLEHAYSLVDNQDKLIILLLDIRDGYRPGGGYVAGYFDPRNLYNGANSNSKNMIYIDTNPGMKNQEEMYSTFAHELQHLINYVTSIRLRPNGQSPLPHQMDTWIDEGLSLMAEYLYQGKPLESRIEWFNEDQKGTIAWGNNFYVWDNYYPDSVLDDYATAYLFFQWLYLQAGEDEAPALLKDIAASGNYDYRAVTGNAASIIPGGGDWETLLRTWLAANYINHPENEYGYKRNDAFKDIGIKTYQLPNDEGKYIIELCPGEGVYSTIDSSFELPEDDSSGVNIRYAGLQKSAPIVNTSGPSYTGDFLLTFNKNTVKNTDGEGEYENGYFTGKPDAPVRAAERAVANFLYPVRIDARDLMRRNDAPDQIKFVPKKARLPADEH